MLTIGNRHPNCYALWLLQAGRGRSTTLVLCYLLKEKGMTPEDALTLVRQKRPQVCLALDSGTQYRHTMSAARVHAADQRTAAAPWAVPSSRRAFKAIIRKVLSPVSAAVRIVLKFGLVTNCNVKQSAHGDKLLLPCYQSVPTGESC